MTDKLIVESLGWGVQSFTLIAMAALGEIEKPDLAIHSDTTHEATFTYGFASRWHQWIIDHGIPIVTVQPAGNRVDPLNYFKTGAVMIPLYTATPARKGGRMRRQCTGKWKIAPMRKYIQTIRDHKPVEMWLGISLDEFQRMRDSDVKYITNRYPLIEMKMTRNDCIDWLIQHDLEVPKKSSCVFCPFHSNNEWRNVKSNPYDWNIATRVDNALRSVRPPYDLFLHNSRKPLETIDLRTMQEKGQMDLWLEECDGVCGI